MKVKTVCIIYISITSDLDEHVLNLLLFTLLWPWHYFVTNIILQSTRIKRTKVNGGKTSGKTFVHHHQSQAFESNILEQNTHAQIPNTSLYFQYHPCLILDERKYNKTISQETNANLSIISSLSEITTELSYSFQMAACVNVRLV